MLALIQTVASLKRQIERRLRAIADRESTRMPLLDWTKFGSRI